MIRTDPRNKTLRKILAFTSHPELLILCDMHGGYCLDSGYISGKTKYLFKDNLFIPTCILSWNRFGSNYAKVKITLT